MLAVRPRVNRRLARVLIGHSPPAWRGKASRSLKGETMARVSTGRCELEVRVWGEGDPILSIHGSFLGEWFHPLLRQPVLDRYKRIAYWRHGYRHSSHPEAPPYPVEHVVDDAFEVLRQVAEDSGHVVAHSLGGIYALQLAVSHPEAVRTLTLIEPAAQTPEAGEWIAGWVEPVQAAVEQGDFDTACQILLSHAHGNEDFRTVLDPVLPEDWFEQAAADTFAGLTVELPAVGEWQFGPEEARQIQCPVLLIRGDQSPPVFAANVRHLKEWIPHAEEQVVPGAGHFELMTQPSETAQALASFLKTHAIAEAR
jgi:pimeloyl-ACP methyl ester carboxylesterase